MELIHKNFEVPETVIPKKDFNKKIFDYEDDFNQSWTGVNFEFEEPKPIHKIEVIEVTKNVKNHRKLF